MIYAESPHACCIHLLLFLTLEMEREHLLWSSFCFDHQYDLQPDSSVEWYLRLVYNISGLCRRLHIDYIHLYAILISFLLLC